MIITLLSRCFSSLTRPSRGHHQHELTYFGLLGCVLLLALAACNDTPPPPNGTALNQLHWCNKPTTLFQDASQSPPVVLTDWKVVKQDLAFTPYLPERLPTGTCLVTGHAVVRDKVLGSMFSVSYVLPDGTPLALSETLVSGQGVSGFQCSPDTGNQGSLLCLGAKGQTSIVVDSKQSEKDLQTLFDNLKPNVDWIPQK